MRILFYRWKAYNQFDLIQNLEQRGHIVDEITGEMANYESDEPFALSLREQFDRAEYDLVMTVNFFPLISNECEKDGKKYETNIKKMKQRGKMKRGNTWQRYENEGRTF